MKRDVDVVLKRVDEKLSAFFEKYGEDSKGGKGIHPSSYIRKLKGIVGVVAGDDELESEVFSRVASTQAQINEINSLIAEQGREKADNLEGASVLKGKYADNVLVLSEKELIGIEADIEALEKGVGRCSTRIKVLKEKRSEIVVYLMRLEAVRKEIIFVEARKSFEVSKNRYNESLTRFVADFGEYKRAVDGATGSGVLPALGNSFDDMVAEVARKVRLSVIAGG